MMTIPNSRLFVLTLGTAFMSFVLAGCFGTNTNAIQGKWTLDPASADGCPPSLEFTPTTMMATAGLGIDATSNDTYKADGSNIIVQAADGPSMTFNMNGSELDMVQPQQCKYQKAS